MPPYVHRLLWPPFVSVPVVLGALLLEGRGPIETVPASIWAIAFCGFAIASTVYGSLSVRGRVGAHGVFQGCILSLVTVQFGCPFFLAWLGVAFSVIGMLLLASLAMNAPISAETQNDTRAESTRGQAMSAPFPFVLLDAQGMIRHANDTMVTILGSSRELLLGQESEFLFPEALPRISIHDTLYDIRRGTSSEGKWIVLLPFAPTTLAQESSYAEEYSGGSTQESGTVDRSTGLLSAVHAKERIPYEIARAKRYRRWLAAVLTDVVFRKGQPSLISDAERDGLLADFFPAVRKDLRDADLPFRMEDESLLLLLPETPQSTLKSVATRLREALDSALEKHERLKQFDPRLRIGIAFYGGSEDLRPEQFMEALRAARDQSERE